ncbi:MAG: hypothetical protein L3J22_07435 [Xanthomonadales bacterium]|nr:hypothetical protein [Xanthomonadales bacterium]
MRLIKVAAALTIACASFFISKSIADSVIHFKEPGLGSLLVNAFLLAPYYLLVLSALMGVIGFGTWNLLSYFLTWGATDSASSIDPKAGQKPKRSMPSPAPFIGRTLLGTMVLVGGAIMIILVGMLLVGELGNYFSNSAQKKYEKTFEIVYPNTSFLDESDNILAVEITKTDARIIFYKRELEIVTGNFTEADDAYGAFEFDVKRQLALSCMVKIFSETMGTAFHSVEGFKTNARNEYVKATNSKIQYMKNEKLMKSNGGVYHYPFSSDYGTRILDHDFPNRCDETMSVDAMYDKFLPIYIKDKIDQANKDLASKGDRQNSWSITANANKIFSWINTIEKKKHHE